MELKDFVGLHEYGGVELGTNPENDAEYVIFMLDGKCYKIEEDPDDGWRSYAKDVEEYPGTMSRRCILPYPIKVVCYMDDNPETTILKFMDAENGGVFLSIGTEHSDDWYPCCRFEYHPENIHLNETDSRFSWVVDNEKALAASNEVVKELLSKMVSTKLKLYEVQNNIEGIRKELQETVDYFLSKDNYKSEVN